MIEERELNTEEGTYPAFVKGKGGLINRETVKKKSSLKKGGCFTERLGRSDFYPKR